MSWISFALLTFWFQLAEFTDPPCLIDLECAECIPDNMPLVTSHRATNGTFRIASGDEVVLACYGGKFLMYPLQETLTTVCEIGRFRVRKDAKLRHLLELGCQESVFEDVLHSVEHCGAPFQGRAYQTQEPGSRSVRHLATVCFDEDRAIALRLHITNAPRNHLRMAPHTEHTGPLSILGNFNHMFDAKTRHDAEKLYSDDVRMNKRLHELLKHDKFSFADQSLTSAKILSSHYFDDQNMRVTDFVSNRIAVWRSVARGNLRSLHQDVAKFLESMRSQAEVHLYSGTHGVLALRTGHQPTEIFLKAGRRFPVPKYIWTVVHVKEHKTATAIVVLNDPYVAVSEIRSTVFCESACGSIPWLHELRRNRNYESPVNGLVFCCDFRSFTDVVTEMPKDLLEVLPGVAGMLTNKFPMN
ncbi:uncharacterized protein LOC114243320 [Bombyx mandarina]|uniref:Uncharacterized protein LOC114243320 n=1 Tax=Bombyx mandarina TaxID=7092 RepID=A0A6J2JQM0_BOMMA|nr:uncharacterized protein LOC114243320 [Bombyx mandarina]